jgi:hypothetical protein
VIGHDAGLKELICPAEEMSETWRIPCWVLDLFPYRVGVLDDQSGATAQALEVSRDTLL